MTEHIEPPEGADLPKRDSGPSWQTQLLWALALVGIGQVGVMLWGLGRNPMRTWAYIIDQPYDFAGAVRRIKPKRLEREEVKGTRAFDNTTVAAGIVISDDTAWVYGLGPKMEMWDVEYPQDVLEIDLCDGRFHGADRRGQVVMPLIEWLEKRSRTLKVLLGTDVDLRVIIASDKGIPFETVRTIMYTAGQAQHSEFEHLQPSFAGLRLKGSDLPTIGPPDGKGGILDNLFGTPKADKDGAESSKAANTPGGHLLKQRMADILKSNAKAKAQKTSAEEQQ
jgi:hypothetical protein